MALTPTPLPYDPDKTCGDYGGLTYQGKPCRQPAGWHSEDDSGRCRAHDRPAEDFRAAKKAEILEILPRVGALHQVAKETGVPIRAIFDWRGADPEFREEFEAIVRGRDRGRASEVEDKVFDRIMADKATPAETIFFLKNRDPDRWRDVFEAKPRGGYGPPAGTPLAPVDSAKGKLKGRLKDMAKRRAEATRTQERAAQAEAQLADQIARQVRGDDGDGSDGLEALEEV